MPKEKQSEPVHVHLRESYEAQLPLIAAILAIGAEEFDPQEFAQDAIDLVVAIEEKLG